MSYQCTKILFFEEVISRERVQPNPKKLHMLTEMPSHNNKELQSFLGINKLSRKFLTFNDRSIWTIVEAAIIEL